MSGSAEPWPQLLRRAHRRGPDMPLAVAHACVEHLDVDGATVSVTSQSGTCTLVCFTDDRSRLLEDAQATVGVGPGVDATRTGFPVLVEDLHDVADPGTAQRWAALRDLADSIGVRAVFALPLHVGTQSIGALQLHRQTPGPLSARQHRAALEAASAVADGLLEHNSPAGHTEHGVPWPSLDAGVVVHQATGMVQVQLDVSTAEALLRLRARAFRDGRTLTALAEDVVDRRVRFSKEGSS